MTPERLAAWESLCAYFEGLRYNATYYPSHPHAYLLCRPPSGAYPRSAAGRASARQIVAERRSIQVIYWRTGKGWQLRKDYREKLAALRAEIEATPVGPRQMQLREDR